MGVRGRLGISQNRFCSPRKILQLDIAMEVFHLSTAHLRSPPLAAVARGGGEAATPPSSSSPMSPPLAPPCVVSCIIVGLHPDLVCVLRWWSSMELVLGACG